MRHINTAARSSRGFLRFPKNCRVRLIACRTSYRDAHSLKCPAEKQRVADVVPIADISELQSFQFPLRLLNSEKIGHDLCRMLKVAQRVDNGHTRILRQLHHSVVRVDSGNNPVEISAQNPRSILHRLSSAKLKLIGREVDRVPTKSTGSNLETRPGPGRRLLEKQSANLPA